LGRFGTRRKGHRDGIASEWEKPTMANLHPTSCALPTNLESSFCLNILLILLKMSLQETHQNHSEPLIPVTGELWRSARQSHPMRVHLSPTNRILILLGTDPAEVCLVERKIHTLPTKNKKLNHIAWAACPARNTPKNIT
jgi:hypothetical protein